MVQPLVMILVCLVGSYIFSHLLRKIGIPTTVGQITTGLILGIAAIKTQLFNPENLTLLSFLANLGVILLFYYVGLETNIKAFTKNIKKSALISMFNTFLPLIVGFSIMKFVLHYNIMISLIIGVCLSVSAQSISLSLLNELGMLKSKLGSMIIATGAVDDTFEMILTTLLLSVFHVAVTKLNIFNFLLDMSLFLVIIIVARLWAIPYALKFIDKEKSSTARFMGSLIILLMIASLSEYLGVGVLIGAMIAGMLIRQTIIKEVAIPNWEEHDIARSIHIIAFGFLIPLFFVWIGLNTDVSTIAGNIWFIILLFVIATVGTVGGTIIAIWLNKGTLAEGMLLGWGLNPKGDVELIIAALALNAAIITQGIFTALVVMSMLTMLVSPIIFKRLVYVHRRKMVG